jgi:hypothetical protein
VKDSHRGSKLVTVCKSRIYKVNVVAVEWVELVLRMPWILGSNFGLCVKNNTRNIRTVKIYNCLKIFGVNFQCRARIVMLKCARICVFCRVCSAKLAFVVIYGINASSETNCSHLYSMLGLYVLCRRSCGFDLQLTENTNRYFKFARIP